jgi:hypothetical protein
VKSFLKHLWRVSGSGILLGRLEEPQEAITVDTFDDDETAKKKLPRRARCSSRFSFPVAIFHQVHDACMFSRTMPTSRFPRDLSLGAILLIGSAICSLIVIDYSYICEGPTTTNSCFSEAS